MCQNRCCKLCVVKSHFRNKINNTVGFVTEGGFLEPEEAVVCLGCRGSSHTDALRAGGSAHHQRSPWLSARQPSTSEKPQGSSSLSGLTSSTQMILKQTRPHQSVRTAAVTCRAGTLAGIRCIISNNYFQEDS